MSAVGKHHGREHNKPVGKDTCKDCHVPDTICRFSGKPGHRDAACSWMLYYSEGGIAWAYHKN